MNIRLAAVSSLLAAIGIVVSGCTADAPEAIVSASSPAVAPSPSVAATAPPKASERAVPSVHPIRRVLDEQEFPAQAVEIRGFTVSYTLGVIYVDYQLVGAAFNQYTQENEASEESLPTVYEATPEELPWLLDVTVGDALAKLGPTAPPRMIYRVFAGSPVPPAHGESPSLLQDVPAAA